MTPLRILVPLLGIPTLALAGGAERPRGFQLEFSDGRRVAGTDLRSSGGPADARYAATDGSLTVEERTLERRVTGVVYVRTVLEVRNAGDRDLPLSRVVLADEAAPAGAHVVGDFSGSPIVAGAAFYGVEHPLARNAVAEGRMECALPFSLPLRPGEVREVSYVQGVASEPGQLRRAFLAYLERERPRPYAPFLHHNTWYNVGHGNRFSEADELAAVGQLGSELVTQRGVKLDGFVLDDGWDDTHSLWRFNPGWPNGLRALQAAAAKFGAAPGIWLSPWGGYGRAKAERLAAAAPEGFEIRDGSFSLAGPRYYRRFHDLCASAVRDSGVAYFKFDGIGARATGVIDPAARRDFEAMLRLVGELRSIRPGLYVSQTTGTWASPWWLLHVDNIWRSGADHSFAGVGSWRQRWMTYRDGQTYLNVVRRGPLFPLNSVMIHGIIYAKLAKNLGADPGDDFRSEVRSYFGTGTQLQELYLSPELLSARNWDDLAAAAKWARAHTAVLRDTHWIGGNPQKLEPYGWAAWGGRHGLVTLRNPSDQPASFALEVGAALELPAGGPVRWRVASPYPDEPAPLRELQAGQPAAIQLRPFEVLVLELTS